jgi:hypothetical protein
MADLGGGGSKDPNGNPDVRGDVGQVVNAVLGLAGQVARLAAEATAPPQRAVVAADPAAAPANVVIHYGVAAVSNIVGMVSSAVRDGAGLAGPGGAPAAPNQTNAPPADSAQTNAATARGPVVRAGELLRIPMSIENPDLQAMERLEFTALAVDHRDAAAGETLSTRSLRFEPPTMTIAARDFEKLTVLVDTQPDTAPGAYEATVGLGDSRPAVTIRFVVVGAD